MDDGHVRIIDPKATAVRGYLPISVRPVGNQWIVDATSIPERIRIGDVIREIDGQPIEAWWTDHAARVSGSSQFKRWRVRSDIMAGPKGSPVRLVLSRGTSQIEERLSYDQPSAVVADRLPAMREIAPGIHYVDVTRLKRAALEQSIGELAHARGIVFDLRGVPTGESASIIPYWITGEDTAKWMSVPLFDRPFGKWTRQWWTGWEEKRNAALSQPMKVLLTDGRLISHLESLTSYFPGQHAGLIVGERTGGVNGNAVITTLPSGMNFYFTGMRVTRHDGSLLHMQGFKPDIEVVPTAEGLRAGRDEVLERAVRALTESSRIPPERELEAPVVRGP
jgi:C-terminal processing protease CtpA/Prc